MNKQLLESMPIEMQAWTAEIESAIGREIIVRRRNANDLELSQAPELAVLEKSWGSDGYNLTITYQIDLPPHMLFHELMHALLFIREQPYPEFRFDDSFNLDLTQHLLLLNNDIEHTAILPIEMDFFPKARKYWTRLYEGISPMKSLAVRKLFCTRDLLRHWMVLKNCLPDHLIIEGLEQELVRRDQMTAGAKMAEACQQRQAGKIKIMEITAGAMFPTLAEIPVRYHDIKRKRQPVRILALSQNM